MMSQYFIKCNTSSQPPKIFKAGKLCLRVSDGYLEVKVMSSRDKIPHLS